MCDAVLSLCHYLDCSRVLTQVENNCMLTINAWTLPTVRSGYHYPYQFCPCKENSVTCNVEEVWPVVWRHFLLATQLELKRVRAACVPHLIACRQLKYKIDWQIVRKQVGSDALIELMGEMIDGL